MVKMYSPAACASCVMSTVGKSNQSSADQHIHRLEMCEVCPMAECRRSGCSWDVGWSEGVMDAEESGKFVDHFRMLFEMVSGISQVICVLDGGGNRRSGRGSLGVNLGVTNGDFVVQEQHALPK